MRKSDLPAVMEIERQSFSDPWDEASFREGIAGANPHAYFLVARHQQAPIAFINFWVVREDAHITNFAVAPTYRNMGVGKYFFARSLEYIKKRGGRKVFLEVRVSNIRAQNLYRQFGFKIISIRKRYYADNGEDAYVFSVDLGDLDLRIRDEHARNLV
jgi:ribosomal-protein-alanine N-acetyltransferase